MISKKVLLGILALALFIEAFLGVAGFASPEWLLTQFKLEINPSTLFLGYVMAWMLLFVSATCAFTFFAVLRGDRNGWVLSFFMGAWWVAIGVGIYLGFGRIDNLFLDSLKGAIILVSAWLSRPRAA